MGTTDIMSLVAICVAIITLFFTYRLTINTIKRNHYDNFFNTIIRFFVLICSQITLSLEEKSKLLTKEELDREMAYLFYHVRSQYRIYIEKIVPEVFPIEEIDSFIRSTINIANQYINIMDNKDDDAKKTKSEMKEKIDEIQSEIGEMYIKYDVFRSIIGRLFLKLWRRNKKV